MAAAEDDIANELMALRLQLGDIEEILRDTTDPVEIVNLNNLFAALQIHCEQLVNFSHAQLGQRVQQSMYQAMLSDFHEVDALLAQENITSNATVQPHPDNGAGQRPLRVDGHDAYYEDNRMDLHDPDLPAYTARLRLDDENAPRECYICMVDVEYSLTTEVGDCNHVWCRTCLTHMFDLAAKNENNYPIRCCEGTPGIALNHRGVASLVGAQAVSAVQAKIVEYETDDKTYCHDPRCSSFIAPDTINERQATCVICQKNTCVRCKAAFHEDECKTANDDAFERWQRDNEAATCNICHRVIIISHGCNHMRCFCGAEFCYECGQSWKTCQCQRWHEARLYERAAVFAGLRGQPADVDHVAEELRNEGDCRHTNWTRINVRYDTGSANCADCHWEADRFLWQCDACRMRVCTRCRRDY